VLRPAPAPRAAHDCDRAVSLDPRSPSSLNEPAAPAAGRWRRTEGSGKHARHGSPSSTHHPHHALALEPPKLITLGLRQPVRIIGSTVRVTRPLDPVPHCTVGYPKRPGRLPTRLATSEDFCERSGEGASGAHRNPRLLLGVLGWRDWGYRSGLVLATSFESVVFAQAARAAAEVEQDGLCKSRCRLAAAATASPKTWPWAGSPRFVVTRVGWPFCSGC
jgi:hypothetical protein